MYAGENFFQVGGHHHQALDPLFQVHQRSLDDAQQGIVTLDLRVGGKREREPKRGGETGRITRYDWPSALFDVSG